MSQQSLIVHASAVALEDRAVLFQGASGSGKSSMALRLMALGAMLVGDDRLRLCVTGGAISVSPAPNLAGLIEARGVGLLKAAHLERATVALVVDLDRTETARLPDAHETHLLGIAVPCLQKSDIFAFPEAILQYLKAGRAEA